jgi:hypothetical protein
MCKKCEKCNWPVVLALIAKGDFFTTEIYRCTNLRCGYMFRILEPTKKDA